MQLFQKGKMNTKFSDYPSYILNAWFLFEAFRRLGFQSKDIYALVTKNAEDVDNLWFGMLLQTQGKDFLAFVEPVVDGEAALNSWNAFANRLVEGQFEQQDMQREWSERLVAHEGGASLASALIMNGFIFPISHN